MTQRQLAERAGVPQPAIARIERGRVTPSVATLDRLLRATGHVMDLASLEGEGVDRTLLQAALTRSPEDRVASAGEDGRRLLAFRAASLAARRRQPDGDASHR